MAEQIATARGVVDPVAGPMSRLSALDAIAAEARSLDTVGGGRGDCAAPPQAGQAAALCDGVDPAAGPMSRCQSELDADTGGC